MVQNIKQLRQKGFTIVELLIVIVVIGILAALVLNSFAGVQQKARDTERQTDTKALATQLEACYNNNDPATGCAGKYPTLANLQDSAWIDARLKGIDKGALAAPGAAAGTNSIKSTPKDKDTYVYVPASDGSSFTLTYTKEGGNKESVDVKSLN